MCVVFFFKPKTANDMRISDWSSDVCSSDLRRITERRSESSRLKPLPRGLAVSGTISPPLSVTATPHERHTARPTPRPGLQAGPEAREAAPRRQAATGRAVAEIGRAHV